jgi:hypothetical protein
MYECDIRAIQSVISRFRRRYREGMPVYVFGVSDRSQHIIKELTEYGIPVQGVIDNDARKNHMYCSGIRVINLKEVGTELQKAVFFVDSPYWREMKRQLIQNGVISKNIINIQNLTLFQKLMPPMVRMTISYRKGKNAYQKLRKKYGLNAALLLCPYTGTGDIYLIGTLLPAYLQKNHIGDYVIIVVNKACKRVADLFGINRVEQLKSTDECSDLLAFYRVEPEKCQILILNDCWGEIYMNPTQWIRGYKGHNFTDMFRKYVFQLSDETKPVAPQYDMNCAEAEDYLKKHHLPKGHTVILSPYAATLAQIPEYFWIELAQMLKNKGFTVVTNSSGEKEPAIVGTDSVFFPLNIAPQVIAKAGYFIGVRSGFCDVISSSKAIKIILYDKNNWFYNGSAFHYFNLNEMGLCADAVEIEFDHDDFSALADRVMKEVSYGRR